MKKKSNPIPMITALVAVVGLGLVVSKNFSKTAMTPEEFMAERQREMEQRVTEAQPAKSNPVSQDNGMKAALAKSMPQNTPMPRGEGESGKEGGEAPKILLPDNKPPKPTPNESAISGQWYR